MKTTPFPDGSDHDLTFREALGRAMEITEQADADQYFAALVSYNMTRWGKSREETERIQRSNLGYYAGYYDSETRERVERLFSCAHPIFGSIAANGAPSADEALRKGAEMGRGEQ